MFDEVGVRFAHEVHPSEIAYDYWTTKATLEAIGHRPAFGLNWDPSHMVWQGLDPATFILDFADRIYHVDCKDAKVAGPTGAAAAWAATCRGPTCAAGGTSCRWVTATVPWEECIRALNDIGYDGPIAVEWEDAGMDRLVGAPEALQYLKKLNWDKPTGSFDAAFSASDGGPDPQRRAGRLQLHGPCPLPGVGDRGALLRPPAAAALHVICGRNAERTQQAADQLGWAGIETDWRALLERDDVDLIDI